MPFSVNVSNHFIANSLALWYYDYMMNLSKVVVLRRESNEINWNRKKSRRIRESSYPN